MTCKHDSPFRIHIYHEDPKFLCDKCKLPAEIAHSNTEHHYLTCNGEHEPCARCHECFMKFDTTLDKSKKSVDPDFPTCSNCGVVFNEPAECVYETPTIMLCALCHPTNKKPDVVPEYLGNKSCMIISMAAGRWLAGCDIVARHDQGTWFCETHHTEWPLDDGNGRDHAIKNAVEFFQTTHDDQFGSGQVKIASKEPLTDALATCKLE